MGLAWVKMRLTVAEVYVTPGSDWRPGESVAPAGGTMTKMPVARGWDGTPEKPEMGQPTKEFKSVRTARLSGPMTDISAPVSTRKATRRAVRWEASVGLNGVRPCSWGTKSM